MRNALRKRFMGWALDKLNACLMIPVTWCGIKSNTRPWILLTTCTSHAKCTTRQPSSFVCNANECSHKILELAWSVVLIRRRCSKTWEALDMDDNAVATAKRHRALARPQSLQIANHIANDTNEYAANAYEHAK